MAVLRAIPVLDLWVAKSRGVVFVCSESFGRLIGAGLTEGRMEMLIAAEIGLECDGITRLGSWLSSSGEQGTQAFRSRFG